MRLERRRRVCGHPGAGATLLDYLEEGDSLDHFLEDFPTVSREHAVAVLELAKQSVFAHADSS